MSRLEKEIYKNRRLMRFNTSLTINEQTDTITITPRMFERLVEDDTFKPLIYESIQKELDKVRNKELKYIPFGDVSDFNVLVVPQMRTPFLYHKLARFGFPQG